jgi:hypothetical protein
MPVDYRQLTDLEEGLDEEHLSGVRFGRSRFLRRAGLVLFGIAAGTVASPAEQAEAAPPGCYGYPTCGTCRGRYCRRCRSSLHTHCPPSGESNQCWRSRYNGRCIVCCDYINALGSPCVCRGYCSGSAAGIRWW